MTGSRGRRPFDNLVDAVKRRVDLGQQWGGSVRGAYFNLAVFGWQPNGQASPTTDSEKIGGRASPQRGAPRVPEILKMHLEVAPVIFVGFFEFREILVAVELQRRRDVVGGDHGVYKFR